MQKKICYAIKLIITIKYPTFMKSSYSCSVFDISVRKSLACSIEKFSASGQSSGSVIHADSGAIYKICRCDQSKNDNPKFTLIKLSCAYKLRFIACLSLCFSCSELVISQIELDFWVKVKVAQDFRLAIETTRKPEFCVKIDNPEKPQL